MIEKIREIPDNPGVYVFKSGGKIIYVGKAKNLKKRVSSYFLSNASEKAKKIVEEADSFEYTIVSNEKEALLLEANLIYSNKPKYNVLLKDTRVYPYAVFTDDEFPYIQITHQKIPGAYGPFTSVSFLRTLIEIINPILQIRNCDYDLSKVKRPCIEYGMKRCSAPCVGLITKEEYTKRIELAKSFLSGDAKKLKEWIREKINNYSRMEMFESALRLKKLYDRLEEFLEVQSVELDGNVNLDVLAIESGIVVMLKIRNGMMLAKLEFEINGGYEDFIKWYYIGRNEELIDRIVVKSRFKKMNEMSKILSVKISLPVDENEERLVSIAYKNLQNRIKSSEAIKKSLNRLKELLDLPMPPKFIEGIDISHTHGNLTVASVVTFEDGRPNKSLYRKYRLSNLTKIDDFESMRQVVKRRYSKHPLPDLLLIDGGKGQVDAVKNILEGLKLSGRIIGLAKEDERIVFPDERPDLHLRRDDGALRILISVRDEAHRFATSYHYSLRDKEMVKSGLDSIPGIGEKRKKLLLKTFKNINGIKRASFEEIKKVVGEKVAMKIIEKISKD
ncbi:MAG: excinuclease ABC subunit C [Mesoaciditoga sp.]|uniref:excinuclease ABC subunit UvrC n=1 Tax=Athalassotoga sp. TaxID=2022597 RepID=UPI000CBB1086|nr:MAG: excinuclease ABC subunit C [Mesoaciditoga sp.]HEU25089.1 excinuclease ABC subunit UvrC [Mesoaciditoga lauensis]